VVTENARVLASIDAMRNNDIEKLGEMMNLSHDSLRDDYQVSCAQLDLLVDTARRIEGVLGARLTGAGFGGCTISLVARSSLAAFRDRISETYSKAFGHLPGFFECVPADGADHSNRD
jgi:galactokinase